MTAACGGARLFSQARLGAEDPLSAIRELKPLYMLPSPFCRCEYLPDDAVNARAQDTRQLTIQARDGVGSLIRKHALRCKLGQLDGSSDSSRAPLI